MDIWNVQKLIKDDPQVEPEVILQLMDNCYICPKDNNGQRLGPLVGYAGTYGDDGKHFVGDIYLNFAVVEEYAFILRHLAQRLHNKLGGLTKLRISVNVFCGAPEGGKALAQVMSTFNFTSRYVYPDRKVIKAATPNSREESKFIWGRHQVNPGEKVVIVEDLNNNFSTTDELIELAITAGASVVAIVSFYNRSVTVTGDSYKYVSKSCLPGDGTVEIPIVTLKSNPILQYKQDDPYVVEDIAKGNVIWKPKPDWPKLAAAMAAVK